MSGDELLGHVGALLRDQLRHRDFAARLGPVDFMIAMPGATRDVAIRVSQRAGSSRTLPSSPRSSSRKRA